MSASPSLAEVLGRYVGERGVSLERLAARSGVPKPTLHRWLSGAAEKPHEWVKVARLADALDLTRAHAGRLLHAAGQPSLDTLLRTTTDPAERALLARWEIAQPPGLPAPLTGFVGREDAVLDITEALDTPDTRLLTLTGPGGSGKTRLALEVTRALADEFHDGVVFVPLAPLTDPALVLPAVARALGVRETAGEGLAVRLAEGLRGRRTLLLLDNFEQVIAAAPDVTALLTAAPGPKVLVTSRAPLRVGGEHEWPVPPLPLPDAGDAIPLTDLARNPAIALFVARARAVNPAFALTRHNVTDVAILCARLDGLPLAIELAAARARDFAPRELLARFPARLDLGADGPRDAPPRQQALRAAIGWSYDLLPPTQQVLFARLAPFAGGCTPEAAVAVCDGADGRVGDVAAGLEPLREVNLLGRAAEPDGTPRYAMLETIREYATERLAASGEEEIIRRRHAEWCLALAAPGKRFLPGTHEDWLRRMDRERDNLRAALGWARDRGDAALLAQLAGAIWPLWLDRGYFGEGAGWLESALAPGEALPPALRAPVLTGAFLLAFSRGEYPRAAPLGAASLALWQALRDDYGQGLVLKFLGWLDQNRGDFAGAFAHQQRGLTHWRALGDEQGIAQALSELALLTVLYRDPDEAQPYFEESFALYERTGDTLGIARTWTDRGLGALIRGELGRARGLLERALALSRPLPYTLHLSAVLCYLGVAELLDDALEAASGHLAESLRLRRDAGDRLGVAYCLVGVAGIANKRGETIRAARLCGAATAIFGAIGGQVVPGIAALYERELADLRAKLPPDAFDAAWEAGLRLSLPDAVADALGERAVP